MGLPYVGEILCFLGSIQSHEGALQLTTDYVVLLLMLLFLYPYSKTLMDTI